MKKSQILEKKRRGEISPLLLIFIIINFTSAFANQLSLLPLKCGFYGSIIDNPNIIVYGDNGFYLFSTDLGKTWDVKIIEKFSDIRDIKKQGDTLFGILVDGSIIYSTNKGKDWSIIDLAVEPKDKFLKLLVTENSIYIRGIKSVVKLNKKFQIERIFRDTTIEVLPGTWYSRSDLSDTLYNYNYYPLIFDFVYDKIVLSNHIGTGFYLLDQNLSNLTKIDLKGKILTDYFTENNYFLANIFRIQNKTVFQINSNLYLPDTSFENYTYFFPDTNYLNMGDTSLNARQRNFTQLDDYSFFEINDSLFGGKIDEIFFRIDSLNKGWLYSQWSIKKYQNSPQDTFMVVGTPLKDIYYSNLYIFSKLFINESFLAFTVSTKTKFGRKVPSLEGKVAIFSEDIESTPRPSRHRLLLLARNYFNEWELVSILAGSPLYILNDSIFFFSFHTEIYRTTDGGITFKPVEFYTGENDTLVSRLYNFPSKHLWKSNYIKNLFYVDSTGTGAILWGKDYDMYSFTKNFFKTVKSDYTKSW
ncbi:MAG: hypothetical protein ACK42G_03475, partial [Candidatus Kapaibacteriota bacterium]